MPPDTFHHGPVVINPDRGGLRVLYKDDAGFPLRNTSVHGHLLTQPDIEVQDRL